MGRKNRSHNNNVKRTRMAVKELARLKKCLGMVDETGKDILEKVADISTITDAKAIKQVLTGGCSAIIFSSYSEFPKPKQST